MDSTDRNMPGEWPDAEQDPQTEQIDVPTSSQGEYDAPTLGQEPQRPATSQEENVYDPKTVRHPADAIWGLPLEEALYISEEQQAQDADSYQHLQPYLQSPAYHVPPPQASLHDRHSDEASFGYVAPGDNGDPHAWNRYSDDRAGDHIPHQRPGDYHGRPTDHHPQSSDEHSHETYGSGVYHPPFRQLCRDQEHQNHRRRLKRRAREIVDQHQIQVVVPEDRRAGVDSMAESMQMMMMNQMMSQQMAQQQMQMMQMNQMTGRSGAGDKRRGNGRSKRPAVNIKTKQKPRRKSPMSIVMAAPPPPPPAVNTIESAAMENWQEATIILCIAIVGVIYLVVSRSSKEEKDADGVAKHLVPK